MMQNMKVTEFAEVRLRVIDGDAGTWFNPSKFTVLDDEQTISLSPETAQITEGDTVQFTASLSDLGRHRRPGVEVGADGDREYTLSSVRTNHINLFQRTLNHKFTLSTEDNDIYEGTTTVNLRLSRWYSDIGYIHDEPFIVTVLDNEPTISLDPLPSRVTEGEVLTATARLSHAANVDVEVSLGVYERTRPRPVRDPYSGPNFEEPEFNSEDYTLLERMVTIPAGQLIATFPIHITDDTAHEDDEYVVLDLMVNRDYDLGGVPAGVVNNPRMFTLVDKPTISLDPVAPRITEGEEVTLTVRLSNVARFDVDVELDFLKAETYGFDPGNRFTLDDIAKEFEDWYTIPATEATAGVDRVKLTIPAGKLTATFTFSAVDDEIYENLETVELILKGYINGQSLVENPDEPEDPFVITILNNGEADTGSFRLPRINSVELTAVNGYVGDQYRVEALFDTALISNYFRGGHETSVRWRIVDGNGNPVASADGAPIELLRPFPPPTYTRTDERVRIFADLNLESIVRGDVDAGDKRYLELTVQQYDQEYGPPPYRVPITVLDRNMPELSLDSLPARITEGETLEFTARLSHASSVDITVSPRVEGDPDGGVDSADYTISPPTVTIPAGELTATFNLMAIDDTVYEGDEPGELHLGVVGTGAGVQHDPAIFTLVDNEPTISLDPLPERITESEVLTVTARLSHATAVDVTVSLQVRDTPFYSGYRDVDSADYTISPPKVTIPAGKLVAVFNFIATDDPDYERDESGQLLLSVISTGAGVEDEPHTFILVDNHPTLSLDPLPELVTEGETFEVTARLSRVTELTVTVRPYFRSYYSTNFDSEDYTFSTPTVIIPAGELTATFTVSIKDDLDYEYEQSVSLNLRLQSPSPHVDVFEGVVYRSFTFVDNDVGPPMLSLNPVVQRVREGDQVPLVVRLGRAEEVDVEVVLSTFQLYGPYYGYEGFGESEDYEFSPERFTIPAGELTATFTFSALDDEIYESMETVYLYVERYINGGRLRERDMYNTFEIMIVNNDEADTGIFSLPRIASAEIAAVNGYVGDQYRAESLFEFTPETRDNTNVLYDTRFHWRIVDGNGNIVDSTVGAPVELIRPFPPPNYTETAERIEVGANLNLGRTTAEDQRYLELAIFQYNPLAYQYLGQPVPYDFLEPLEQPALYRAPITVLGRDTPVASLDPLPERVTEGQTLDVTARLSHTATVDVTVSLQVNGIDSADYTLSPPTLTIPAGQLTGKFTIRTIDDTDREGDETAELRLSVIGNGAGAWVDPRTFILADNEPTLSLDPLAPRITEGESSIFTARLSRMDTVNTVVEMFFLDGSAGSDDYSFSTNKFTIPAGDLTADFTFSALDDAIYEGLETVELLWEIVIDDNFAYDGRFLVTILDNEPTLSLDPLTPQFTEGDEVPLVARLSHAATVDLEVELSPGYQQFGRAAQEIEDYWTSPARFTIPAGELTTTFTLSVVDDEVHESTETVELISGILVDSSRVFGDSFVATIADNDDAPTLSLDPISLPLREGGVTTVVARLSGAQDTPVEVVLEVVTGGTAAPEDYAILTPLRVTIEPLETTAEFMIMATADNFYEGATPETLELRVSSMDVDVGTLPTQQTLTIMDGDSKPTLSFKDVTDALRINENGPATELRIERSVRSAEDITFTLGVYPVDGKDPVEEGDYTISPQPGSQITIPGDERSVVVTLSALDDADEQHEAFELRIESLDSSVVGVPGTVQVDIIDDDAVEIGFDPAPSYSVNEDSGIVELTVSVTNGMLTETVLLSYVTRDGSAVAGSDYMSATDEITLSPMTPSVTFTVPITDDTSQEPEEKFTVELSGAPADITLDPAIATVTIIDNDAVVIGFDPDMRTVNENAGTVELTVSVISGMLMQPVLLSYVTRDGSAVAGSDYMSAADEITLSPLTPSVTFMVPITDDTLQESEEKFTVVLSGAPADITLDPAIATVTIPENDQPSPIPIPLPPASTSTATILDGFAGTVGADR